MPTEMEPVVKTEELVQKSERQLELEERRKFFHGEPLLNVVKKDEFQKRVAKVFKEISDILACSFGASGAPTIISKYPYSHVTKDGFTIFKNITCDIECGSIIDSVIANLIGDICGRLNYKVGDGTTTAIIATNAFYETYYEEFDRKRFIVSIGKFSAKDIKTKIDTDIYTKKTSLKYAKFFVDEYNNKLTKTKRLKMSKLED